MRPFGGFGIDGLVVRGDALEELNGVVALGGAQEVPADGSSDGRDAGPAATEPGYTLDPVGGFDRWPGGLKG